MYITRKDFAEGSKILAGYRSENNLIIILLQNLKITSDVAKKKGT